MWNNAFTQRREFLSVKCGMGLGGCRPSRAGRFEGKGRVQGQSLLPILYLISLKQLLCLLRLPWRVLEVG